MGLKILEHLYNYFTIHNIKFFFSQSKKSDNSDRSKIKSNEIQINKILI
jgi:hypothetical protein